MRGSYWYRCQFNLPFQAHQLDHWLWRGGCMALANTPVASCHIGVGMHRRVAGKDQVAGHQQSDQQ